MPTAPFYAGGFGAFGGAPSVATGGMFPEDPRTPTTGVGTQAMTPILFVSPVVVVSAVPAALAANNIALSQSGTTATALTLTAGTGVTKVGANYYLDGAPAANATSDPTKTLSRAIRVVSAGNDSGITFAIVGTDLYGVTMTQTLTGANAGTATTTKAFKSIVSVTPSGNTASTVTVGTTDVYGLPMRSDEYGDILVNWNNAWITANTGYVAAVTTSPATGLTGDVRGTYLLQTTASNGALVLTIWQYPKGAWTTVTSMFGVTQA